MTADQRNTEKTTAVQKSDLMSIALLKQTQLIQVLLKSYKHKLKSKKEKKLTNSINKHKILNIKFTIKPQ